MLLVLLMEEGMKRNSVVHTQIGMPVSRLDSELPNPGKEASRPFALKTVWNADEITSRYHRSLVPTLGMLTK
jgi:hypothetical protein